MGTDTMLKRVTLSTRRQESIGISSLATKPGEQVPAHPVIDQHDQEDKNVADCNVQLTDENHSILGDAEDADLVSRSHTGLHIGCTSKLAQTIKHALGYCCTNMPCC